MLLDQVDAAVEAYEAACEESAEEVDLRAFAPSSDSPHHAAVMVELIRVDMERRWRDISGSRIEHYRALFPEVLARRDSLSQIAFEEYRLKVQAQEPVDRSDYERRYGIDTSHWPELTSVVSSLYATQHPCFGELSASDPHFARSLKHADQLFPQVGQELWGFRLKEELGRGAFGRVYLAQQTGLADRLVALKVTAGVSHEPMKLAQLQHTHIVPIYSQHGDGVLQGFCMPFLGRATLAQRVAGRKSGMRVDGPAAFVSTARVHASPTVPVASAPGEQRAPRDAARQAAPLTRQEIHQAVRIAQKLATGLAHAHDRGIIHCDLKPANILISDDGEPLILDFHVARSRAGAAAIIGGTLPYMSPEQLLAFERAGDVDARSDIYSLGVILYELLAGELPCPPQHGSAAECVAGAIAARQHPPLPLSRMNRGISPGLSSIVARCLAPQADARYQSAAQLAEDLDRHLHDLPLRHAADRSWRERLAKWSRRHPRFASTTSISIACALLIAAMALGWHWREEVLADAAANSQFHEVDRELPVLWGLAETESLDPQQREEFTERAASIAGRYPLTPGKTWRNQTSIARLPADHQAQLLDQLRMIAFLEAELALADARHTGPSERARQRSVIAAAHARLRELDLTPENSPAVSRQAERAASLLSSKLPPAVKIEERSLSSLDQRLLALQMMREREHARALPILDHLSLEHPDDVALVLQLGNCYRALKQLPAAEGCYSACVALRPDLAFPLYFRGLLHLDQQQFAAARRDFTAALTREETATAHINLALACRGLNKHREAAAHLERALALKTTEARVWLLLAHSRQQLGDDAGAAVARAEWQKSVPTDTISWVARGVEQLENDPTAAERAFREALKLAPDSRAAMQNLAHLLAERQNQPQEAIALLSQALATAPDDALLLGSRGVLYARLGDEKSARADAAAALACGPNSALAWYQAACIEALLSGADPTAKDLAFRRLEVAVSMEPALGGLIASDSDLSLLKEDARLADVTALATRLASARSQRNLVPEGTEE